MSMTPSDLICSKCGFKVTIFRKSNNLRETYHIKDLYCCNCKKTTKHIEVKDLDILKKKIEFQEESSEMEQLVYKLTYNESDVKKYE